MPFLGNPPIDQYQSLAKQTITGDGSTAYTLNRSVTNEFDIEVFINNVRQEPTTSYTAIGNTITFTAAVTSGDSCYLIYQGQSVGSINPPANSVGTNQITNDGVHTVNIADTAITHAKLHTDMDLSSKTVRIDSMNMGTGTDQWQLATQSSVSNRFALRSTHTTLGDGNPFIIYQPSSAGAQNDALVISADGIVRKSKHPIASVTDDRTSTINGDLNGTNFYNSIWANQGSHFNASTGRFTCPVDGIYRIYFRATVSGNMNVRLRKNGASINEAYGDGSGNHSVSSEAVVICSANDYLHIQSAGFSCLGGTQHKQVTFELLS
jgi:hypothetical protein